MTGKTSRLLCAFLALGAATACSGPEMIPAERGPVPPPESDYYSTEANSRTRAVVGTRGMVVADDRVAAAWGAEILKRGGNAVDAAVATAFALAVTRPHYAALGGGGFMVYCPAPGTLDTGAGRRGGAGRAGHAGHAGHAGMKRKVKKPCTILDYRERAPAKSTRDMYIVDGKARTDLSQHGSLSVGVPGVTAGLLHALEKWGSMDRDELIEEPIRLAREGVVFTSYMEMGAKYKWPHMNDEARRLIGCGKGRRVPNEPCKPGQKYKQSDLARVLQTIVERGRDGFYKGWVAKKIVDGLQTAGGIMTLDDLKSYQPVEREPVLGTFRGMEVVAMPPPSAGGTNIIQMLGYVERADRAGQLEGGFGAATTVHAISHGMALAFADRAEVFGDPDFVKVPLAKLTAPEYLDRRWQDTFRNGGVALPDGPGVRFESEPTETTHFSVIDRHGNAVAITTTVNDFFGSGFVPPGTGVVLNDEMDDFSTQPGVPNLFGLVGAEANAVAPGKRPLSSMSPTIVRDGEGNARLVLGAAGGPRITTGVFQVIVNRLRFAMTLPDAVAAPKFHHQWKPSKLFLEFHGFPVEVKARLRKYGYELEDTRQVGRLHALERFPESGRVWGVPDPRAEGAAVAEPR